MAAMLQLLTQLRRMWSSQERRVLEVLLMVCLAQPTPVTRLAQPTPVTRARA